MKFHERSTETAASPERVWRIWSDMSTWAEWNPNVSAMKMDGPFGPGATGIMTNKSGQNHKIQFTSVEPGRSFVLETSPLPLTRFAFRCEVAPGTQGKTRISQGLGMSGPLAGIFGPMMGDRIAASFTPLLHNLAAKAER